MFRVFPMFCSEGSSSSAVHKDHCTYILALVLVFIWVSPVTCKWFTVYLGASCLSSVRFRRFISSSPVHRVDELTFSVWFSLLSFFASQAIHSFFKCFVSFKFQFRRVQFVSGSRVFTSRYSCITQPWFVLKLHSFFLGFHLGVFLHLSFLILPKASFPDSLLVHWFIYRYFRISLS